MNGTFLVQLLVVIILVVILAYSYRKNKTKVDQKVKQAEAEVVGWPSIKGTVLNAGIDQRAALTGMVLTRKVVPQVSYEYVVDGKKYLGSRIIPGDEPVLGSTGAARRVVARYPVGASVDVYYNPANPARAVLEKSWKPPGFALYPPMVIFIILMIVLVVAATLIIGNH